MVLLASLVLFDFVSMWTAHESVPEFQLIKVDAVTGATACTDVDGDHFCAELGFDCDDTDPAVFPNAPEVCDGKDNNCNGIIDGGCSDCTDGDGDGYALEGDLCGKTDCNDGDEAINPAAEEICDDQADNNCDGRTDTADPACDIIPPCTDEDDDGFCAEEDDCNDSDPLVKPGAEEACGDEIDNNCNDRVDEDCPCPAALLLGDDTEGLNILRAFRDETLARTEGGRMVIRIYYDSGPVLCTVLEGSPGLRKQCREWLAMLLKAL